MNETLKITRASDDVPSNYRLVLVFYKSKTDKGVDIGYYLDIEKRWFLIDKHNTRDVRKDDAFAWAEITGDTAFEAEFAQFVQDEHIFTDAFFVTNNSAFGNGYRL